MVRGVEATELYKGSLSFFASFINFMQASSLLFLSVGKDKFMITFTDKFTGTGRVCSGSGTSLKTVRDSGFG